MRLKATAIVAMTVAALAALAALAAQTGNLTGRVQSDDGSPVIGAQVSVEGTGLGGLGSAAVALEGVSVTSARVPRIARRTSWPSRSTSTRKQRSRARLP